MATKRKSFLNVTGTVMTTLTVPFEKVDFEEIVDTYDISGVTFDELIDIYCGKLEDFPIKLGKNEFEMATSFFTPILEAHVERAAVYAPKWEKTITTDLDDLEEIPYDPFPMKEPQEETEDKE